MNARAAMPWVLGLALLVPITCTAGEMVPAVPLRCGGRHCLRRGEGLPGGARRSGPPSLSPPLQAQFDEANGRLLTARGRPLRHRGHGRPGDLRGPTSRSSAIAGTARPARQIERRIRRCVEMGCEDPIAARSLGRDAGGGADRGRPRRSGGEGERPSSSCRSSGRGWTSPSSRSGPSPSSSGALDSFNPRAFFGLFTLLGILGHAHLVLPDLFVGGTFVAFSGHVLSSSWRGEPLPARRRAARGHAAAGVVALVIAAINVKDYFLFSGGSPYHPREPVAEVFEKMRRLFRATSVPALLLGTVALAVAAEICTSCCACGFPTGPSRGHPHLTGFRRRSTTCTW